MRWSSTNNENHTIERFQLSTGHSAEMVLRYNPIQHSGRLERHNNHLLFFIEQTGLWGNKFLFENEYGVEIGRISFDNMLNLDGMIQIDRKKLSFKVPLNPTGDVFFIPNKFLKQHFNCIIDSGDSLSWQDKKVSIEQAEKYACMILGFFWWLFPESIPEANKAGIPIAFQN